jgi:RNA polymerase sigma-70 factor (ECF subfamily)
MDRAVRLPQPAVAPLASPAAGFAAVYDAWGDEVLRWVGAMGAPAADVEDLAQEVFIVVDRKLGSFDGRNLPGWLYGISRRVVAGHRRRLWVRGLFLRRVDEAHVEVPGETPISLLERKQARQLVARVLDQMSARRRRAFALYEIEGYSGEEIGALEGVPLKTVWTRLHHARKDFVHLAGRLAKKRA